MELTWTFFRPICACDVAGTLDVLVHAAGIVMNGTTMSLSLADYDKCMNVNTRSGHFLNFILLTFQNQGSV